MLFDGHLVLTSTLKKAKRCIVDIATWMEAFSIYSLVLTSHFPHRWRDLSQYKLLILRTYQKFSNRVWLAYDRAFREHAAATNLTDWSNMNVQLFNFHAAGASTHGHGEFANESAEPAGAPCSQTVCKSWNRGPMSNVVFRIAVQAVLGLIMPQPALAWLPQHLRRFQKGDPHPHVAPASPDAPEEVLSFLLAFAPRLLGLVVFLFSHGCLLLHVRSRVGRGFLVH